MNRREHVKQSFGGVINITEAECKEEINKYIQECEKQSIPVPRIRMNSIIPTINGKISLSMHS